MSLDKSAYCKFSKFQTLFPHPPTPSKIMVFRAEIPKTLVRIWQTENTQIRRNSQIWVCSVCLGLLRRQLVLEILEHLLYLSTYHVCSYGSQNIRQLERGTPRGNLKSSVHQQWPNIKTEI